MVKQENGFTDHRHRRLQHIKYFQNLKTAGASIAEFCILLGYSHTSSTPIINFAYIFKLPLPTASTFISIHFSSAPYTLFL